MKFLVVFALFALAAAEPEAEADPWLYYNHAGLYNGYNGYAYNGYPYTGYGYTSPYYARYVAPAAAVVKPVVKAAVEPVEPVVEAKKAVVYAHPFAHLGHLGYAGGYYNYPAVTYAGVHKPYTYYANSGGAVHVVKREAESDPKSWYSNYGYYPRTYGTYGLGGYYGGGYGYHGGYGGWGGYGYYGYYGK
jgi:hypothetical protein